jgi:aquaporin Z
MGTEYISPGHYSLLVAFVAEIVLTTMFVITVLGATDEKSPAGFAGLAIGLGDGLLCRR